MTMIEDSRDTAQALTGLSRALAGDRTVNATLVAIVRSAQLMVPGVRAVGITYLGSDHRVLAQAETDTMVTAVEAIQQEVHEGPGLEVLIDGEERVTANDLRTDPRWPAFAPRAVASGVLCVWSSRLFVGCHTLGVLSLYADTPGTFDDTVDVTLELLAGHAAVALSAVQREDQFSEAVRRRDVIGQAKGVLMSQHSINEDAAFATLVRFSQGEGLKLHEVAVKLMESMAPTTAA